MGQKSSSTTSPVAYSESWCNMPNTLLYKLWEDQVIETRSETFNDPQSRPKPTNLIESMTPSALQTSNILKSGDLEVRRVVSGRLACVDGIDRYWNTRTDISRTRYVFPSIPWVSFETGDWATGLRLQLKSLKVNLGEDLAEYRQTASMFSDAAHGIKNAWDAYRGLRRRRRITPCAIPAANLIYSFGVAPLVGTVYDSVERLRSTLDDPTFVKVVQSAKKTVSVNQGLGIGTVTGKQTRSSFAQLYVKYDRGSFNNFTVGNPLEIAWELVPYSFVIDYMIPIGDALSALDALVGVSGIYGTVTHRDSASGSYTESNYGSDWTEVRNIPATGKYRGHSRELITSVPMPGFPNWRPSASWHKLRNAVALLWQTRKC